MKTTIGRICAAASLLVILLSLGSCAVNPQKRMEKTIKEYGKNVLGGKLEILEMSEPYDVYSDFYRTDRFAELSRDFKIGDSLLFECFDASRCLIDGFDELTKRAESSQTRGVLSGLGLLFGIGGSVGSVVNHFLSSSEANSEAADLMNEMKDLKESLSQVVPSYNAVLEELRESKDSYEPEFLGKGVDLHFRCYGSQEKVQVVFSKDLKKVVYFFYPVDQSLMAINESLIAKGMGDEKDYADRGFKMVTRKELAEVGAILSGTVTDYSLSPDGKLLLAYVPDSEHDYGYNGTFNVIDREYMSVSQRIPCDLAMFLSTGIYLLAPIQTGDLYVDRWGQYNYFGQELRRIVPKVVDQFDDPFAGISLEGGDIIEEDPEDPEDPETDNVDVDS